MPVPTREQTRMQQCAEAELTDTAQIMRASKTSNGAGGFTVSAWAAVEVSGSDDVPCLLAPYSQNRGSEMEQGGQAVEDGDWVFTFPADVPVVATDRIEHSSATYEVTQVRERRSLEFVTRAIAKKVQ